ncbi:MAG: TOMM system kinase/cyclase fusion protein [Gammaproteobacteria bacterium]
MDVMPEITGYKIIEHLGSGGFAMVYLARQESTGQQVAIKILQLDEELDDQQQLRKIERFSRETQLCAGLQHPHIVKLLDKGRQDEKQIYAVFEYLPGETLKHHLLRQGPFTAVQAGELMGQVLDALACAHAQGIVHRDLKPQNIMITTTGTRPHAKVLDFGIGAFLPEARQVDYKSLTLTLEAVGTPSYSAPEQLRGEPPTIKSDLYAWGLLFLECLTGQPVMQGESLAEIFHKQLSPMDVPLPPAIAAHPVAGLLRRVLQKNPRDRVEQAARLYTEFRDLNLNNIVGSLDETNHNIVFNPYTSNSTEEAKTQAASSIWKSPQSERRQITVLCFGLSLTAITEVEVDMEVIEALQRDQMSTCLDIGVRYGGYAAGSLGDSVMLYFGYPFVSDNDTRRAARTALELSMQVRHRSSLLQQNQGIKLELRIGIHSGAALIISDTPPSGLTPNMAFRLAQRAKAGTVLVSETTHHLLEQYIEFEQTPDPVVSSGNKTIQTYLMTGERRTEAMSFLRTGNITQTMIGRKQEYDALQKIWADTKDKQGTVVFLTGEAGIGKSRLVYEMRQDVLKEGFLSSDSRCYPEQKNNALYPILAMLKVHLRLHEVTTPKEAVQRLQTALQCCEHKLDWLMPIFCSWFSLPVPNTMPPVPLSPEQQKQVLLEALEQLIIGLGDDKPFLLTVEDVHWIDPTSMELLDRLLNAASNQKFLMIISARPEFQPHWNKKQFQTITLQRLAAGQVEDMIRNVVGEKPIDKRALSLLSERTDGIPLFVEELTRMMLGREYLIERDGVYVLGEQFDSGSIPITLQDSLNESLGHLGPAKETAQLAATIGREFDYALLSATSMRDEAALQADVELLLSANLVYRQRRVQGEGYIFRHALIRDAAYDSMLNSVRQQAHARIADAMLDGESEAVITQKSFDVAAHYAGAADYDHAIEYATKAAEDNLARSLNEETLAISQQTLRWSEYLEDDAAKARTELKLNGIMFPALMAVKGLGACGLLEKSQRNEELWAMLHAHDKSNAIISDKEAYLTQWVQFQDSYFHGKNQQAIFLGEQIIFEARENNQRVRELLVLPLLGQAYHTVGDLTTARECCERALALYRDGEDDQLWTEYGVEPKSQAMFILALVLCCSGKPESATVLCQQALDWARQVGCAMSADAAISFNSVIAYLCADADKVIALSSHYAHLDQQALQEQWLIHYCKTCLDWANHSSTYSLNFIEQQRESGLTGALCWYEAMLAETLIIQEEKYTEAIQRLTQTLQRCEDQHEVWALPLLKRTLALACYHRDGGLTAEVKRLFTQALISAEQQGAKWLALDVAYHYGRVFLDTGDVSEASTIVSSAIGPLQEGVAMPLLCRTNLLLKELNSDDDVVLQYY